jgi:hypothetical protein
MDACPDVSATTVSSRSGKENSTTVDHDRSDSNPESWEELRDTWERVRETAAAFGDQRIYALHDSIMFSRNSCYSFASPKKASLTEHHGLVVTHEIR